MANERQENKPTQNTEDKLRRSVEESTEQTRRIGLAATEAGQQLAKTSANLLQQNAEMLQNTWGFGLEIAAAMMGHSTDHVGRALGFSGEQSQEATKRSARNAEGILYSATAVSKGMNEFSKEFRQLAQIQIENQMKRMNELWQCRTPQDLAAVQTDMLRESLERVLESSRRLATMSVKVADEAATHIKENMQRAA